MGYARVLAPHRKPYRTADGYMTVLPYTDRHWRSFFAAVGRPDLAADERFSSVSGRSRNVNALYATLAELMPEHTTARWQEILSEADIPHVPVRRLEDLLEDPHLREVGFFPEFTHPTEGPIRTTAVPTRLAASPGDATRMPAPRLGEHTRAVLSEAGLPASAIESLIAARAAVQG
jgi:crotonobetainyl-CoA:carnitine CoA-transferase CaiB-like acyl-CoA transferase